MRPSARIARALLQRLLPQPVPARHAEYSMLFSADDELSRPSPRLLSIAQQAIQRALTDASTAQISVRMKEPPYFPDVWPGELYKLLIGLVLTVRPNLILEVGTGGGTSTLAMKQALPAQGRIVTFDLLAWRQCPDGLLRDEDFRDGRLL